MAEFPNIPIDVSAKEIEDIIKNPIRTEKIANRAITEEKVADGAITTAKIGEQAVTFSEIANKTITNEEIADKTITNNLLADKSVDDANIVDNSITPEKFDRSYWEITTLTIRSYSDFDNFISPDNDNLIFKVDILGFFPGYSIVGEGSFTAIVNDSRSELILHNQSTGKSWSYIKGSNKLVETLQNKMNVASTFQAVSSLGENANPELIAYQTTDPTTKEMLRIPLNSIVNRFLDKLNGTVSIPLNTQGYMEGGNGWFQQNTSRTQAKCSGYIEIPSGYKYIKANLDINKYGWAILFSTANGSGQITDANISVLGASNEGVYDYLVEIPSNAKYVFVSSYIYTETNYAYFTNGDIEDETTVDVLDGTEFALFRQWGIVGDSLSVGHTSDTDGNASSPNLYYSWGQYLARRIGNTCLNFGRSGVGAKTWMSDDNGYNLLVQPENLCQCYILALGANDADMTLGSIADVDFSNMDNNADNYFGWYAKVINAVRTTAPQAPIFLFTLPYPRNTDTNIQAINNMIREFASNENFSMIYLVDLDADYNDYFKEGKLGNCIGNTGWHLTALGYLYASVINEIAISKVMAENYADFQNVFEIPFGSKDSSEEYQTKNITDSDDYFTNKTVEGALQELGAEVKGVAELLSQI